MTTGPLDSVDTAQMVASNLRRLREDRGLSLRGLSEKLNAIGWTLSADAINKIENGRPAAPGTLPPKQTRKADAGDVVALASVLGVSPNALLLPPTAGAGHVRLTPKLSVPAFTAWRWATGDAPLPDDGSRGIDLDREHQFRRENAPHRPPVEYNILRLLTNYWAYFDAIRRSALAAKRAGVPMAAIKDYVGSLGTSRDPILTEYVEGLGAAGAGTYMLKDSTEHVAALNLLIKSAEDAIVKADDEHVRDFIERQRRDLEFERDELQAFVDSASFFEAAPPEDDALIESPDEPSADS